MDTQAKETEDRGHRVTLAVEPYSDLVVTFPPLKTSFVNVNDITEALKAKGRTQGANTKPATTGKEEAREAMALIVNTLSKRMVGYAKVKGNLEMIRKYTLTYSDVRYGEEEEDKNHVQDLVDATADIPATDRTAFRITPELIEGVKDSLEAFEQADDDKTTSKAQARLASMSIPQLVKELQKELDTAKTLLEGVKDDDEEPRWMDLWQAFSEANKRQKVVPSRRYPATDRTVSTIEWHQTDNKVKSFGKKNYPENYRLVVENTSNSEISLWMAVDKKGKPAEGYTPVVCPPAVVTELKRSELGPDLAKYLFGKFHSAEGGSVKIKVRKVVEEA